MPVHPRYPGVYVEEDAGQAPSITGVSTSISAFVGFTGKGPPDRAVMVSSFAGFVRTYGGLHRDSAVSYAVRQFFTNGGTQAVVVRVGRGLATAGWALQDDTPVAVLDVAASSPGAWGNGLRLTVDRAGAGDPDTGFDLVVSQLQPDGSTLWPVETHRDLSMDSASTQFVESVVNQASDLITVKRRNGLSTTPAAVANAAPSALGLDGTRGGAAQLMGSAADRTGLHALLDTDLFNILSIPETYDLADAEAAAVIAAGVGLCEQRRAFYIVDAPSSRQLTDIATWVEGVASSSHAATYFPAVRMADPLDGQNPRALAPSGTLAGLYARTDAQRGVWKAPAGTGATLSGLLGLAASLSDNDGAVLNGRGVNALRSFPASGPVAWGARTLKGTDAQADAFKYVPVRRLALYIEESLVRGTPWAVSEADDESLWAQIRLAVGAFMNGLFRQGAFQGQTAQQAWFVKCDAQTTTPVDIDAGIVNIVVGFAPLKPAEFVVLRVQQRTGSPH